MLHSIKNFILRYFRFIIVNMNAKSFLFLSIAPTLILTLLSSGSNKAIKTTDDYEHLFSLYSNFVNPIFMFPHDILGVDGFLGVVLGFGFIGAFFYILFNTFLFSMVIIGEFYLKLRGLTKKEWEEKEEARKALWDKEKVRRK